jgi:uncharacterized cofD-like protein
MCGVLGARGRVLPMSCDPLDIVAEVEGLEDDGAVVRIRGQVAVAATPGRVRTVALDPPNAPGCPEAVAAIDSADLVILGPGSWFTSVLPHLMLPDIAAALIRSPAHRLVVLNLAPQPGETEGFSPEQHLDVLSAHAPQFRIDTVLADVDAVALPGRLSAAARRMGARLELARIAFPATPRHDPAALARALLPVLSRAMSERLGSEPGAGGTSPADRSQPPGRAASNWSQDGSPSPDVAGGPAGQSRGQVVITPAAP